MIAEKLTNDLQQLIDQIHQARAIRNRRRAAILNEQPSHAGASELAGIDRQFASLRLAEDILQDAIKGIREIEPEPDAAEDPWDQLVGAVLFVPIKKVG
jgi:hypothetical protein